MEQTDPRYPRVKGEFETVRRLLKGSSIARFGDGELKILEGREYSREPRNGLLTAELRMLVAYPNAGCVIGLPTMDPAGPKYQNWRRHERRFCGHFWRGDGNRYYSAFITRPDSAADNLESQEYFALISRLWSGKRATVVSEPDSKTLACVQMMADTVHVECPSHQAYSVIDQLEQTVIESKPEVALLSCGPTATCLANRLAGRGIHAIDMGSVGGLLMRWMPGNKKRRA